MISIDPGVEYYACAVWDSRLRAVGLSPITAPLPVVDHELVIEKPQVYRHAKARNSDIVDLAVAAGRIAAQGEDAVYWYLPRVWKGQVPKKVHHERICAALTETERTVLDGWTKRDLKHILDAVGLGLYHLGRLRP